MSEWTDIGEQLRKARESKGLDLKDVAHTTRIPLATLKALEESDYSIFPSPTYAKSFLSQYSDHLEVDAHEWIDAFETGDVLSNVNDHGYLQTHNEHVGSPRHQSESSRSRNGSGNRHADSSSKGPSRTSSILQTMTVLLVTALLIGGGIYAYTKFEPILKEALAEEKNENESAAKPAEPPVIDSKADIPADPTPTEPAEPTLVVQNKASTDQDNDSGATSNNSPAEPTQPVLIKPTTSGKPPKALVIDEE